MIVSSKRYVSIVLCAVLLLVSTSVCMILSANNAVDYIVWEANTDTVLTDFDKKINAFNDTDNAASIVKNYDMGGGFYRVQFSMSDKGSASAMVSAKTDISSNLSGFGWMANKNVLNKLKPYLKISFQYRLTSDKKIPNDAKLCIFATSQNSKEASKLITVPVSRSESFTTISLQNIENTFDATWNDGYFSVGLYSESSDFEGFQILDIRGLKLVISSSDRESINSDINSVKRVTAIANFTSGVSLSKYKGVNDYFTLFTNFDKKSNYGTSFEAGSYPIYLLESGENVSFAVSQTRAKGTVGDKSGDTVVIDTKVLSGYTVKDVVILKTDGSKVDFKQLKKNEQYSFVMPDTAVTVEIVTEALDYEKVQLLWQMQIDQYQPSPWYYGNSWPCSMSTVPLDNHSAYSFKANQSDGTITLYGISNSTITREDYVDTAVVSIMLKTDAESEKKLTLSTNYAGLSKVITVNDEWQTLIIPLKEIALKPDFHYFTLGFNGFEIGESFFVGPIYIWSFDTGKTDLENYNSLMNIDGYKEERSNEVLKIIGYYGFSDNPYNERGAYPQWDAAWYMKFRGDIPWIVTPRKDEEVAPYQLPFYIAKLNENVKLSEYTDTGYIEFYIKTSSEKAVIPFTLQAGKDGVRQYVPFFVTYDVLKARDDGWMLFRIPFTYFRNFGLYLDGVGILALTGNQPLPDELYISPFRFYSNYAEIEDPAEVPEDEPIEERALPIELDSKIINAVLDKENEELLVPENTYLWEILSAITLDSKDVTVDFIENGEILMDENEIITEGMKMRLYKRGIKLMEFDVYYQIEE